MKRFITVLAVLLMLCMTGCTGQKTEIPITASAVLTLPDGYSGKQNEDGVLYTAQNGEADYLVRRIPKESSLEEFAQARAAEQGVFCNYLPRLGQNPAVLNYADALNGEPRLNQCWIYEDEEAFVQVSVLYHLESMELAPGIQISIPLGYSREAVPDSIFPEETMFQSHNLDLPTLRVRAFGKNVFEDDLELAEYSEDGWTLEEWIAAYGARYSLLKGEILHKNGLDIAFIGYIEENCFKVRAVIDCGTQYRMLCAEAPKDSFQHVTNALLDLIHTDTQ